MSHRTAHRPDRGPDARRHPDARRRERPHRPRRALWSAGFFLLAIGLAGWFAPAIVANTSLRDRILPALFPEAEARFRLGGASLGWLSPVQLTDIEARDGAGELLLEIDRFATEKTLWALLRDSSNVGMLQIAGLTLHAEVRENGSNLEDALAPLFAAEDDTPPPAMHVEIRQSRIELRDTFAQSNAEITIDQAAIALRRNANSALETQAAGTITDDSGSGRFQLAYGTPNAEGAAQTLPRRQLQCSADGAPLRPLACLLRRAIGPSDLAGQLTADLTVTWDGASQETGAAQQTGAAQHAGATASSIAIAGSATARRLQLAAPAWLGDDVFRTSTATYSGKVRILPARLIAQNLVVELDHGQVSVDGSIPRSAADTGSLRETLKILAREDLQASGQLDLARLAAALPQTLRIREDTTITGGGVTFHVDSRAAQGRRAWNLHVGSSKITATSGEQSIVWDRPIVINVAAHEAQQGPVIDELTCQSNFMQIVGRGDINDATLSARADLTALAHELEQFIDMQGVTLAGTADVGVRLARDADQQQIRVEGGGQLNELKIATSGFALAEKNVGVQLKGRLLSADDLAAISPSEAVLTLTAGDDVVTAKLAQPIHLADDAKPWPLHFEAQGALPGWAARLAPILPLEGWKLQGDLALQADVEVSGDEIRIVSSQCDVSNLIAAGNGHHVREQMARATLAGKWMPSSGRIEAALATLATTSWSLRGDDVVVQPKPEGLPDVSGRFAFRSDIRRTLASLRDLREPPQSGVRGIATGNVVLQLVDGVATADVASQIENLVIESMRRPGTSATGVRPAAATQPVHHARTTLWTERQLKIGGRVVYQFATDTLQVPELKAEASGAALTCSGELTSATTAPHANIQGEANYNLAALVHRLRPLLGQDVLLVGADTATFSVYGPLLASASSSTSNAEGSAGGQTESTDSAGATASAISPDLEASGKFVWESARLYGLPIGAGELHANLRRGILDFKPLSLAVSDGKLNLAPRVYFHDEPAVLTLDRGKLLDTVQLTPPMCRGWLKYVAPLLADATDCQGNVSVELDRAAFPLAAPENGTLAGTLTIHGAEVRPGPLASGYINLVQRVRGALQGRPPEADRLGDPIRLVRLNEQELIVNMVDGRVHHEGLTMKIGDVDIVTSGSVGTDQSLDLIAEIPVQDSWIEGRSYLTGLQGQTLKVAIRGTVGRPRIDFSIIEELGRRTLTGAASRVLRREINDLLGDLVIPPDDRPDRGQVPNNPLFRNLIPPELTPPEAAPPNQPQPPAQPGSPQPGGQSGPPRLAPPRVEFQENGTRQ